MTSIANPAPDRSVRSTPILNLAIPLESFLQPVHRAGFFLLSFFFFLGFSRVMDVTIPGARIPFIASVLTLICFVLSGGIIRAWQTTESKLLAGFTIWCIAGIPFAEWRGGAFGTLSELWSKSYLMFVLVVGLTVTVGQARRLMSTVAFATLILTGMALFAQSRLMGRLTVDFGMFSNPNDLAQVLLLAVPLLFTINIPGSNIFFKIVSAAAAAPMIVAILQTGSRSGLLALLAMIAITFFRVGYRGKVAIALIIVAGGALVVTKVPDEVVDRYRYIFGGEAQDVSEESEAVAVASAASRKELFLQSLRLTIRNPILGVGLGNFQHASVQETSSVGKRAMWRETHNMYTQVSAETGLPGFCLYFGSVFVLFRRFRTIRKQCEADPRLDQIRNTLFIYSTSLTSVLITGTFSSVAYHMVFPSMFGIGVALANAASLEIDRITAAVPSTPQPVPAPRLPGSRPPGRQALPQPAPQTPATPRYRLLRTEPPIPAGARPAVTSGARRSDSLPRNAGLSQGTNRARPGQA
jgi:O-antigen ligase